MTEGFHWAPKRVWLGSRIALGVAVMRVWVGFIVLAAGVAVALSHFQTPPEPAGFEQMVAHLNEEGLRTSAIAVGGAGGGEASGNSGEERLPASWERRTIIVASRHVPDASGGTVSDETLGGVELVRALQAELQRVGCYSGAVDGRWGPLSKGAMSAFTDRVNASLSVEKANHVLLRMVRAYDGQACGSCRSGESHDGNGRCAPASVLANGDADSSQRNVEPLPGRMSVGGPLEADANAPITRYTADVSESQSSSRPARRDPIVVERDSPPPAYRTSSRRKHWTEQVFEPR